MAIDPGMVGQQGNPGAGAAPGGTPGAGASPTVDPSMMMAQMLRKGKGRVKSRVKHGKKRVKAKKK